MANLATTFTHPRTIELSQGMAIYSSDCMLLGEVSAVEGIYFRVSASAGRDFWLSTEQVLFSNRSHAELTVSSCEVAEFKLSRPGAESWDPPSLSALEDGLLSESEQQRQRDRMERELRVQLRRISRPPGDTAA